MAEIWKLRCYVSTVSDKAGSICLQIGEHRFIMTRAEWEHAHTIISSKIGEIGEIGEIGD